MFSNLLKATIATAILPLDVVRDIVTLCGELDDGESSTIKRAKQIGRNIDEALK